MCPAAYAQAGLHRQRLPAQCGSLHAEPCACLAACCVQVRQAGRILGCHGGALFGHYSGECTCSTTPMHFLTHLHFVTCPCLRLPTREWASLAACGWCLVGGHGCAASEVKCAEAARAGAVQAGIPELTGNMAWDCSRGHTGVLVNGRELGADDLALLQRRGLPTAPHHSYTLDSAGNVHDARSNRFVLSLGMLAPS